MTKPQQTAAGTPVMADSAIPGVSFNGPVPWARFVPWEATDDGGFVCTREKFKLIAWPDKGPPAGWKGRVEFEGKMIGECVCLRLEGAQQSIQRALVKLAVFHGMPIEPVLGDMIVPLLVDPSDKPRAKLGLPPSRRVGLDKPRHVVVPGTRDDDDGP